MRRDAALYEPVPPRTGRRGRPRTKGERLPTPAALSSSLPQRAWIKAEVVSRYADRWAIEVTFRNVKQDLGGQNPRSFTRQGPERAAAVSLWLHAAIWCWYLTTRPAGRTWTPRPRYRTKTTPSFLDTLAALRREMWGQRITAMSRSGPEEPEITEAVLNTLAYAA